MSDMSQGPGWWQASDGKWYPPEQAPGGQPAAGGAGFGTPSYGAPGAATAYGAPAGGQGQLAEWPQRVIGYLLDLLCLLPLIILAVIFGAISSALGFLMNLVVLAGSFYFAYLNGTTGQSPGKRLIGLKVVNESTGQVIGGGNGVIRNIAHFVDSLVCLIGWFLPLFDAKKQTIADKIMSTVVVTGAEKQPFGPDLFK
jgi:uncharacterized RDD family membrane protein YckC